jgi:L-seryl-tRNA(Ser) seleniumtransferase
MANKPDTALLKSLPQIEEVLQHPALAPVASQLPRSLVADAARTAVDALRARILAGEAPSVNIDAIARDAAQRALALTAPSLRRVINASGVIIHTNLGRSVLAPEAIEAVDQVIAGYSTLEYSVENMARGSRHAHCEKLICALTGAEAAIAVNNNAAAVMMVLTEFAGNHEAVVSRGELVEIGGSFRIPDIMELSHARMVEIGTTNKTHDRDYQRAITDDTAMLLKVHPSNYRMIGFTDTVGIATLRTIADNANAGRAADERVLVYEDQGSGAFLRLESFGDYAEPTVAESLHAGADLVSFSGDKLLGGPQAGIIVGSKDLIDRLKSNPLARALRLDKMTLAALEATLRLYLAPDAAERIPTVRMLSEDPEAVRVRAEALRADLADRLPRSCANLQVIPEISRAGGGSLPMCDIPTFALEVEFLQGDAQSCDEYLVRRCATPIVARVKQDRLLCDLRTVLGAEERATIAQGILDYFASL